MYKFVFSLVFSVFYLLSTQFIDASNYKIEHYDVQVEVQKNGIYDIKETINVQFTADSHGIYRTIPTFYNARFNGESQSFYFPIRNIQVNEPFTINNSFEGVSIRIGDANVYADKFMDYEISYEMISKPLHLGEDLFYFNIIGNEWGTSMDRVSFTILFDETIDFGQVQFYLGHFGASTQSVLPCTVDENRIACEVDGLNAFESITMYLPLDNYFDFPTTKTIEISFLGIIFFFFLGLLFIFMKIGKDPILVTPVSFVPPKGFNSAMCGYVINLQSNNKDLFSLLFEWGKQGVIELYQEEKVLKIKKIKELDQGAYSFEKMLFQGLFQNRDEVQSNQLPANFGSDLDLAKKQLKYYFKQKDQQIMDEKNNHLRVVFFVLLHALFACFMGSLVYFVTYSWLIAMIAGIIINTVAMVLSVTLVYLKTHYYVMKKTSYMGLCILYSIFVVGFFGLCTSLVWISNANILSYILYCGFYILSCGITLFIDRRTPYGNTIKGQVIGLKQFITLTSKDQIEMLMKDDPTLFYDVLPYAMALGVANVWEEHFRDMEVTPPTYYHSPIGQTFSTYWMLRHFNSVTQSMNQSIQMAAINSGNPGGTTGPSGGGFSGGGFGGGGGSSW